MTIWLQRVKLEILLYSFFLFLIFTKSLFKGKPFYTYCLLAHLDFPNEENQATEN